MDLMTIPFHEFNRFFLIFIRVGVILFILPFFNSRTIPVLVKIGLALVVTLTIYPTAGRPPAAFPATTLGLVQLISGELVVGMILGFTIQIFFEGVRLMGQTVGFQTGFAITNIIDPQHGSQVSLLSNLAYLAAMVLFLLLNGHHLLLKALRESFDIIPVGQLNLSPRLLSQIVERAGDMFMIGIKIGAPAIAALLFTKIIFGLITKLIPQMNIMIVAFPVQIVIGLLFFGVSLQGLLFFMERYLGGLEKLLLHTMEWLKV